jgi:hypothetical protein
MSVREMVVKKSKWFGFVNLIQLKAINQPYFKELKAT